MIVGDQEYKARFERYGYTHRFAVLVGEETVVFEPDEEGGYSAFATHTPPDLLQALAEKLIVLSR
ncbi:hypothetical protein GWR56_13355 [Mucilaginibacter sp. 14171R-50]|uniref:hypothetical protein n=1 Tax=Mucilaginibacter sp. 14171R-50 TaxID=2703789 RepID=UPI00138B6767|nr:hypothetical protein [Mucilaginibacter sp. 14171R-50]QHS56476.1 hypothetical protein GWR56_13355 [Mucilaginibacter sp. 14171R-50]